MSLRDLLATLASVPTAGRLFREARAEQVAFSAIEAQADALADESKSTGEDKAEDVTRLYSEAEGRQRAARVLAGAGLACIVATVILPLWLGLASASERARLEDRAHAWALYAMTPGLEPVPKAEARRRAALAQSAADRESPLFDGIGLYVAAEMACAAMALVVGRRS